MGNTLLFADFRQLTPVVCLDDEHTRMQKDSGHFLRVYMSFTDCIPVLGCVCRKMIIFLLIEDFEMNIKW